MMGLRMDLVMVWAFNVDQDGRIGCRCAESKSVLIVEIEVAYLVWERRYLVSGYMRTSLQLQKWR